MVLDADEEEDLVARTVGEELEQRMLVARADRGERSLAVANDAAVEVDLLAETLGRELREPGRERGERVGVRHQHPTVFCRAMCAR